MAFSITASVNDAKPQLLCCSDRKRASPATQNYAPTAGYSTYCSKSGKRTQELGPHFQYCRLLAGSLPQRPLSILLRV